MVILYEGAAHMYRTIYMDGRQHSKPDALNPTGWANRPIGHYEGNDTLVVDTVGFNGRTWLDYVGHPTSESLHVVEKYSRPDSLTLAYEATIEDKQMYTKPWTTKFYVKFRLGWGAARSTFALRTTRTSGTSERPRQGNAGDLVAGGFR